MIESAKYVHTNLVARDWRTLARFYQEVFGCVLDPPERSYSGPDLAAGTGLPGARLEGVHLRLPGCGREGPTLEIFQYGESAEGAVAVNRPGFAHIAFAVSDVQGARAQVLEHGGAPVGEVVTSTRSDGAEVVWCYVADPEGNVLELQNYL